MAPKRLLGNALKNEAVREERYRCFSWFSSWLAKLVKKIRLNAKTAMPILYVKSMSEKNSANMETIISPNTRTSCTLLMLPKPSLKLIFTVHL